MENLHKESIYLRSQIIKTLHATGGGHFGGSLSVVDILLVLYKRIVTWIDYPYKKNDRVILSKGHSAVALYSILSFLGVLAEENLKNYGKIFQNMEGHPDMLSTPGVDFSSGSLGQGLSVGLGMALGLSKETPVWVVLGDGECQEGQIWEAALLSARYKVSNLHVIIDTNKAQEFGYGYKPSLEQDPLPQIVEKWKAFGWHTEICDGHDLPALESGLLMLKNIQDRPSVLIAKTRKGSGVALFESNPEKFHCTHLTELEYSESLGGLI